MTEHIFLSAADIIQADDLERRELHIPEWGGFVNVRALTGQERAEYTNAIVETDKDGKLRPKVGKADLQLAFLSLVNEDGSRMFTDRDGFNALAAKSNRAIRRIVEVATELSGLNEDAVEVAEGN